MEQGRSRPAHYWTLLTAAEVAFAAGDLPQAEQAFLAACDRRDESPGRVFFTEKLSDGLGRLVRRGARIRAGRWARRADAFRDAFGRRGETVVREGVRLAELRPEDDAERNQPVLETALFLVARSRLFLEEPASAVPLLKGLFRTASRTGRPFDVQLVRHDIPLTEEDRLWMARKGSQLLEAFVERGILAQGSSESEEWAQVFLQLLQPRYFGSASRLEEERCWLEAVTADRLLGRAADSVELYRTYLEVNPDPGPRPDEARVRLLELLGNTDRVHFDAPRYDEALRAMQSAGLAPGSDLSPRFRRALSRIEYRRPEDDRTRTAPRAWASVAVEPDGRVAIVFWWGDEPRDTAFWRSGEDCAPIDAFLAPCADRIVAAGDAVAIATRGLWETEPAVWTVEALLAAVMESRLPLDGLEPGVLLRLGLGETSAWRAGWDPALGHPFLEPPRSSSLLEAWQQGPAASALLAGLNWLSLRGRLVNGDPALRAGIGEMARRGDRPSQLVYDFLCLGDESARAMDSSFEPWTLPLLWTRPDPFGWTTGGRAGDGPLDDGQSLGLRPDLGRNDLAIVSTGDAPAVLAAWGEGRHKWRVVLDRFERLAALSRVVGGVVGPVTVIPGEGTVHSLDAALDLLEDLLRRGARQGDDLLPLFHWIRLVETHNGDLLDFRRVRRRARGVVPLYDAYAELVAPLPRETPAPGAAAGTDGGGEQRMWADQFCQRVRKAGLVAGAVDQLTTTADVLDSMWGVFEGSDASWVFLDSAAVHWSLLRRPGVNIAELHVLLHSRGRRHLSLLTGAVWLRSDLEDLLGTWLKVFGSPYCLSLTDNRPPVLRLADRGVTPDARIARIEALAAPAAWAERVAAEDGRVTIQVPGEGLAAEYWQDVCAGRLAVGSPQWRYRDERGSDPEPPPLPEPSSGAEGSGRLVVPVLASLGSGGTPLAGADTRAAWARADAERRGYLAWRTKLCALEMAQLMAGPWRGVDVLDTRWWRLLRSRDSVPSLDQATPRWSGETALAVAAPGIARTVDLPGSAPGDGPQVFGPAWDLTAAWLRARSVESRDTRSPQVPVVTGVHLIQGDVETVWDDLKERVELAWERGRLEQWVLVVSDLCPGGAARLVADGLVDATSVWPGDEEALHAAPILWAVPEDFEDPGLQRFLATNRPAAVLAGDVAEWLPAGDRSAQETAMALRTLLDSRAERVVLHSHSLPPAWSRFLTELTGGVVVGEAEAATGVDPLPPSPPVPRRRNGDCGEVDRPGSLIRRFKGLLARIRTVSADRDRGGSDGASEPAPPSARQLLPVDWLAAMAGLDADDVELGVSLLRWLARLSGDPLSAVGGKPVAGSPRRRGHALLIHWRFADLEPILARIEEHLVVLLPLWVGHLRPGNLAWIDLEQPPATVPAPELALLDTFLSLCGAPAAPDSGLSYRCPRGLLYSTRRLVGVDAPCDSVVAQLTEQLRLFGARMREVLASATETGDGFLVETGLEDLRPDERAFMGLGTAMGFWRWLGPSCPGATHLVDLLTLADSSTVKDGPAGWQLLGEVIAGRFASLGDGCVPVAVDAVAGRGRRGLRQLLGVGSEASDDLDPVVERVGRLAGGASDDRLLVLRGLLGSGRHEAVVRGLQWARLHADELGELTVHCPDPATAAMLSREALAAGVPGPLDIRVAEPGAIVNLGQLGGADLADPGDAVVIMCEVQRFEPETRYRIAQLGRGRRLLMTVDPAAATEPWEHLFLTTPRTDDVVDLVHQRGQARKLASAVSRLVPEGAELSGQVRRRDKGHLAAEYAANLDQGLARLAAAHDAGELPDRVRLTAPLATDLEYLGSTLMERGWLAVRESRLDFLLLPGPREILAAATDALARAGVLTTRYGIQGGNAEPGADRAADTDPPSDSLLVPRLLGPGTTQTWREWWERPTVGPDVTLQRFAEDIAATGWGSVWLAHPSAARRLDEMLAAWGREPLRALPDLPLWEAWWYTLLDDVAATGPSRRRPLVLLTEAARLPGSMVPGGLYLCQGTEAARRHYEILARISDQALVLYQEVSPLPNESQ